MVSAYSIFLGWLIVLLFIDLLRIIFRSITYDAVMKSTNNKQKKCTVLVFLVGNAYWLEGAIKEFQVLKQRYCL